MIENVGSFLFSSNFDSGNLAKVVKVDKIENEFNLWTQPDCANTEFENGNRTWFYFSVKGPSGTTVKFNIMNLNRQAKLYSQGMKPLYRILPQQSQWDRIKERPTYNVDDHSFTLSFRFTMPVDENSVVYFAFCYPYSYSELQEDLDALDARFDSNVDTSNIFYKRDLLCYSLDQRRVDVLTVTSKGDENHPGKPVVFVSARVHPGETPSSFVLKGLLDFILRDGDIRAQKLREKFIFKIVPMLNPDGVYRGHYRTDSRGVNLNRVYLATRPEEHPTIAATKELILSLTQSQEDSVSAATSEDILSLSNLEHEVKENLSVLAPNDDSSCCHDDSITNWPNISFNKTDEIQRTDFSGLKFEAPSTSISVLDSGVVESAEEADISKQYFVDGSPLRSTSDEVGSKKTRLFAYIDLHGHASKRGIFMYGNHFKDPREQVECLLLPKLVSLNSQHFDFWACNFTEKNMYLKDKRDGLSKEGSGRVAVYKLTGIVPSYTLECNYNTGRMRNVLSPLPHDKYPLFHATSEDAKDEIERLEDSLSRRRRTASTGSGLTESFLPAVPYTDQSFQEVGEALAISLLDLVGANPLSRLSQSIFGDVEGVRHWIRYHCLGQKRFQFVEADLDDASAGSHITSTPLNDRDRLQQVAASSSNLSETSGTDGSPRTMPTPSRERLVLSPPKRFGLSSGPSPSPMKCKEDSQMSTSNRMRVPWPGSCRQKEPASQSCQRSPCLTGAVGLSGSSSEFSGTPTPTQQSQSHAASATASVASFSGNFHYPKQQKSPSTPRRVPRKKSLRKPKTSVKKELSAGVSESSDLLDSSSLNAPSSPPKVILKRKRRKSRNSVGDSVKEKRKLKISNAASDDAPIDESLPSTSASSPTSSKMLKSPVMKKKKLIRKKKAGNALKKKRAAVTE